jgi:hypothetical protein
VLKRIPTLIDLGFKLELENEGLKKGLGNKLLFLLFKIRTKSRRCLFSKARIRKAG